MGLENIQEYEKFPVEKRREFFRKHFPESFDEDDPDWTKAAECLHMIAAYIVEAVESGDFRFTPTHINPDYRNNPRPILHDWLMEDLEDWIA
jgi:hypothetical protein